MARSSIPGKKGCHATWKLDLHDPTTGNGTSTKLLTAPVLYSDNVHTKGLADLNNNGLRRVRTLVDDGLTYKTASDINTAITAVQEQLKKNVSKINPSKAQTLWFALNNKAVGQAMPAVSFNVIIIIIIIMYIFLC